MFGVTLNAAKEDIFIPYNCRRAVHDAGTRSVRFSEDFINYPRYEVKRGDIITAHLGYGDEKRRKATAWAPQCVWENTGDAVISDVHIKSHPFKNDVVVKPQSTPRLQVTNLLASSPAVHLKKLDPRKDSKIIIRFLDKNRKQHEMGYGPLKTMLRRDAATIHILADRENITEALLNGKWEKVHNPFLTLQAITA